MKTIDTFLLRFFQKFADILFDWIRIPSTHLAFVSYVTTIALRFTIYCHKFQESFSLFTAISCIIDIFFYWYLWIIFKRMKNAYGSNTLDPIVVFLAMIRQIYGILGVLTVITLPFHFMRTAKPVVHGYNHALLTDCEILTTVAFLYFISCKQRPLKKHPLKEFFESISVHLSPNAQVA